MTPPPWPRCRVPVGRSGDWAVQRFYDAGHPDVPAGEYTELVQGDILFMSDSPLECRSQWPAAQEAIRRGGHVLVTGLGLGLFIDLLQSDESNIQSITVLEKSADVIALVKPYVSPRARIIKGDALTWLPPAGMRYSVIWHDIWPDPYAPEVPQQIETLHARFASYCDWQGSWRPQG